jgi:hypothetical protein
MVRKIYSEAKSAGSCEREIMLNTGAPMYLYVSCRTHGTDKNKQIKGICIRGR